VEPLQLCSVSLRQEVRRADSADSVYVERWFRKPEREREDRSEIAKEVVEESLTWMGCGSDGRQG